MKREFTLPVAGGPLPVAADAPQRATSHEPRAGFALRPLCLGGAIVLFCAAALAADTCTDCHAALPAELGAAAAAAAHDIHARHGLTCAGCHGGDPTAADAQQAMSPAKGFRGRLSRKEVPQICAHCHSDAVFMERYKPSQRVDQYAQYQTSVHGKRLAAGDQGVAECADCHGAHGIREVRDPLSPVHPLRLPGTCAGCHADAAHMAPYKIPTNQFAEYRASVHWEALEKRGDLSAPSCASCHGNHGATPPQVASVAAVCGSCHALMEDLFAKSPHGPVFSSMPGGGCVVCHSNHFVRKPSDAMLAGPNAVCATCHEKGSPGGDAAVRMAGVLTRLDAALGRSDAILKQASRSGMEVSEAVLQQQEGQENLVKARVAVHASNPAAVGKPAEAGLSIAAAAYAAGQAALKESTVRRFGLGVSLFAIAITILGLRLTLRRLERKPGAES